MPDFKLHSEYQPTGDQPQAIAKLVDGLDSGLSQADYAGVTGSGKHSPWPISLRRLIGRR